MSRKRGNVHCDGLGRRLALARQAMATQAGSFKELRKDSRTGSLSLHRHKNNDHSRGRVLDAQHKTLWPSG